MVIVCLEKDNSSNYSFGGSNNESQFDEQIINYTNYSQVMKHILKKNFKLPFTKKNSFCFEEEQYAFRKGKSGLAFCGHFIRLSCDADSGWLADRSPWKI